MPSLECLAEAASEPDDESDGCLEADIPDCPGVTVGEYDRCFQAQIRLAQSGLAGITCDSILEDLQGLSGGELATPQECEAIAEKCPELVGDSDPASGAG